MGRLSILLDSKFPSKAVVICFVLNEYADREGHGFHYLKTIVQWIGLSKSTIKRFIKDLTESGFIQKGKALPYV